LATSHLLLTPVFLVMSPSFGSIFILNTILVLHYKLLELIFVLVTIRIRSF
jgi:hypothetical protein